MNSRERLDQYLSELRGRIRALIYMRAAAVALAAVLLVTCAAVVLLSRTGFPSYVTIAARVLLSLALIVTMLLLLWWPLRKLGSGEGAAEFERRLPAQQGRIRTYLDVRRREARGERTAFAELLADDAVRLAKDDAVEAVIPGRQLWISAAVAVAGLFAVLALLVIGPGHWGYGSRHVLLGAAIPREAVPERRIVVKPGNATVRRNSDLSIVATMQGFDPEQAAVFVRFDDEPGWQRAPMQPQADRDGSEIWTFKLYALRGALHYYVAADDSRSTEHLIGVADLPKIERVRLTYSYPQWTDLPPVIEESQRDIRAVAATQVQVEVFADAPLQSPALIVNGEAAEIGASGYTATGTVTVGKPGSYYIGAKVANDFVPLTEDYAIEVIADAKPSIEILKPGRDWRATSIEEVPVRIQAQDDFRLQGVELRYAVNGGKWQSMQVSAGGRQVESDSLLNLEELGAGQRALDAKLPAQLAPGDLVSYYAVAKDRSRQVQTDLFMVQVQPFERRFIQNQAGAGGGGGDADQEQGAISERQKEILLATWNLQRSGGTAKRPAGRTREQLAENAAMLADLQTTLALQARTVAERTRARVSLDQDERVRMFVESMEGAALAMDPAARHLKELELAQAVPVEQQALRQLLRAESAFREVQVSMQQQGAGSAGNAESARNFSEMFELEMDLEKNQYETHSPLSQENQQQELDAALRKLKELAERQEKLAQQAERDALSAPEQRWRQEQLRREAEDLQRRLAELSKEQQGSSQQSAQQSGGSQAPNKSGATAADERSADGRNGGDHPQRDRQPERGSGDERAQSREQLADTLQSLNKALDDMRAANQGDPSTSNGARSRADSERNNAPDQAQSEPAGSPGGEKGEREKGERNGSSGAAGAAYARSAQEAGRNLRQALTQMESPPEPGLTAAMEQLAARAQQLSAQQSDIESGLQEALNEAVQTNRRRGSIDPKRARTLAEAKQKMARELAQVQKEMRDAVHDHRLAAPAATQRLGEALVDLERSNAVFRIGRSADEIMYGRAREAAPREGLIGEALDALEAGLHETVMLAAQRREVPGEDASAEQMLARIAELRRSLQQAQATNAKRELHEQASAAAQHSQGGASQSEATNGDADVTGLTAWNPTTANPSLQTRENGAGQYREAVDLSDQLRNLANRIGSGELNRAEINALRRMTQDLRRLAGNPLAEQVQDMAQLLDQIELTAFAATEKRKDRTASRTTIQNTDSPEYRDAVAEYYRRLGGSRASGSRQ